MDEGVLTPELPSNPFALQRMGPFLLSMPVSTAPGEVPPSAGNHCRSRPLPLARSAHEVGGKPDRWAPPVGDSAQPPVALAPEYAFINGKRIPVRVQLCSENVKTPKYVFFSRKRISSEPFSIFCFI